MEIDDNTCCCYTCGAINIGHTLDECDVCPECGAPDIASFEDVRDEIDRED